MKDRQIRVTFHQVIFIPATKTALEGSVYLFGGDIKKKTFRYDVATDEWYSMPDLPKYSSFFTLLPLFGNRYILVFSATD